MKRERSNPANFEEVAARLEAAAIDAVTIFHAGLLDGSESTRIRAAAAILSFGTIFAEIHDLKSRVGALEKRK